MSPRLVLLNCSHFVPILHGGKFRLYLDFIDSREKSTNIGFVTRALMSPNAWWFMFGPRIIQYTTTTTLLNNAWQEKRREEEKKKSHGPLRPIAKICTSLRSFQLLDWDHLWTAHDEDLDSQLHSRDESVYMTRRIKVAYWFDNDTNRPLISCY